jgi:hypothetical protein
MITRPLLAATLAVLSLLTACGGGGQAEEDSAQVRVKAASVGGTGGSGVATSSIGGIGGSGLTSDSIGGIGGSGVATPNIGGIGGIGGSGLTTDSIGGIGGSGIAAAAPATACGLSAVNVTVAGMRLNQSATAAAGDAGWFDVVLPAPLRLELFALSTGATLPMDLSMLPDGTYAQAQLLLVANDAATPLADSTVTAAGVETALAAPGGLGLSTAINVNGGRVSGSWTASAVCQAVSPSPTANH